MRISNRVQALISGCLRDAGSSAPDVGYVAVHGTGTPLGDPIEVGALAGALGGPSSTSRQAPLILGSVKVLPLCSSAPPILSKRDT